MQRSLLFLLALAGLLTGASLVSAQSAQVHVQIDIVDQESADVVDESELQEDPLPPPPDQVVYAQPAPQPVYAQPAQPVYAPPAYGVSLQRDLVLRQQLSEYRLGGPIAMMASGLALGVIFAYSAAIVYDVSSVSGCFGSSGCVPNRRGTAILGTISGVGFSLAIIGTAMLIKRVISRARVRREYNASSALADGALFRF